MLLPVVMVTAVISGCNNPMRHRTLAIDAAQRFQALYNSGSCQQLYDDASEHFRSYEARLRWSKDCGALRARFGRWTEFKPESNNAWPIGPVGIVWVRGLAQFENGAAQVRLDWDLATYRASLYNILIEAGGEQISIPGFTGEVRN